MKRLAIDLDGTLCPEGPAHERPYQPAKTKWVELVNRAYEAGWDVTIYSARHWNDLRMTQDWLKANAVSFHRIVLGKVPYDLLIDDRATHDFGVLEELLDEGVLA